MSENKSVVVTGASSGIGQATVKLLSQNGFKVFAGSRNPDKNGPVPGVEYGRLDVDSEDSVRQFVEWVLSRSQRIDVLVNNAGVSLVGPVESTSDEEAKAIFETNLFGPLRMLRAVLPAMRKQNSGLIINVSSVLGFLPAPYMGLYASSKHALEGLSETLDHEVRQFNIRSVLVEPTFTRTGLDVNARQTEARIDDYAHQLAKSNEAVLTAIKTASSPKFVAEEIMSAINGPHKMRRPVGKQATLLSRLKRFVPAKALDGGIRKTFGLPKA
ncbi:oxidoreductase [Agrobacterium larrymoorei]|uniref:oxidoreductase n=1 Tax=Agrobacterium larrymoorei TaxID=160699 RepID=UPI0015728238|nr:oxidoreductase [Agrobacterium larrymoorei]NTJ44742.1 oxidoreductase [Agrobacterium larrymoorei]